MPSNSRIQTIYTASGNPDTMDEASLYKPAELGGMLSRNDRLYQLVQCDTGATAATGVGVVAAAQLAFWKDRSAYLVTNDLVQTQGVIGNRNQVAGVFRAAITAGRFCFVLKRGQNIGILATAGTYVAQESAIADSGVAAAMTRIAAGTAPTHNKLGEIRGARGAVTAAQVQVDVNIPEVE